VLGLAHVEDLETIAHPDRRAEAERKVLTLGRRLILSREGVTDFGDVRRSFAEARL
jgi:5-methylthioribose kinase